MGLLQRISDLIKSNIQAMIDKAEDPEKLLNTAIDDMQKQLIEAKSRVAVSIADEKRLQKQLEGAKAKGAEWEKQAMSAIKAGRDDLAMQALAKKKEHDAIALQFEQQLVGQKAAVEELKKALTALTAKIEETKRKRSLLVARAKRAEAQRHIAETLSVTSDRSALEKIERMEQKVERVEAEAEAHWELASMTSGHERELEEQIKLLEANAVDDDLMALKDKMRGMGMLTAGAKAALPAGAPRDATPAPDSTPPKPAYDTPTIHAEVEEVEETPAAAVNEKP
ncbi:PspA/IM30 family protein [Myxococcota bacterium]|nr:PspA/IM30 family protein [Myxococcota bacterium]